MIIVESDGKHHGRFGDHSIANFGEKSRFARTRNAVHNDHRRAIGIRRAEVGHNTNDDVLQLKISANELHAKRMIVLAQQNVSKLCGISKFI